MEKDGQKQRTGSNRTNGPGKKASYEHDKVFDFSSSNIVPNQRDDDNLERGEEDPQEQKVVAHAALTKAERVKSIKNKLLSRPWADPQKIDYFGDLALKNEHWVSLEKLDAQLDLCKMSATPFRYAYFSSSTLPLKAGLRLADYFFQCELWILGYSLLACVIRHRKNEQPHPSQIKELVDFGGLLRNFDANYRLPDEVVDILIEGQDCWPTPFANEMVKFTIRTHSKGNKHTDFTQDLDRLTSWLKLTAVPLAAQKDFIERTFTSTSVCLPVAALLSQCPLTKGKAGQDPHIKYTRIPLRRAKYIARNLVRQGHLLLGCSLIAAAIEHELVQRYDKKRTQIKRLPEYLACLTPGLDADKSFVLPPKVTKMFRNGKEAWHPDLLTQPLALRLMKNNKQ